MRNRSRPNFEIMKTLFIVGGVDDSVGYGVVLLRRGALLESMNAQKFSIGQRVQYTAAAKAMWPRPNASITCPHIATVKGFARDGAVRVLFDGHKTAQTYHPDFLEAVPELDYQI